MILSLAPFMLAMLTRKAWALVSAGLVAPCLGRIFENVSELPGNLEYDFIVAASKYDIINAGTQHSR
jgi:hypothetical protein